MKRLPSMLLILISIGTFSCKNDSPQKNEIGNKEKVAECEMQAASPSYKLYPTDNMWTFIKLDTRNGKMWQVQFSIKGDDYRFEMPLNTNPLVDNSTPDRFELYPTRNMYNFVLLDTATGDTWQVQWSTDKENQAIIPIK